MKKPGYDGRNSTKVTIGTRTFRVDRLMARLVEFINTHPNVETLACCSGHGRYPMTIIIKHKTGSDGKWEWKTKEMVSGTFIPRKRRFYVMNKEGFYFVPEVVNK